MTDMPAWYTSADISICLFISRYVAVISSYLNPCHVEFHFENIKLCWMVNTTATEDWLVHEAKSSAAMVLTLIARFMGPTWGPSRADRTQVGPMLAPWTLLSGDVVPSEYSSFSTSGFKGFWEWHLHLASNWSKIHLWEIKSLARK